MRKRLVLAATVVATLTIAGTALAASGSSGQMIEGYDSTAFKLVYRISPSTTQGPVDCALDGTYQYQVDPVTGAVTIDTIPDGGLFPPSPCDFTDLQALDVTGPNGQVNHGQIVSHFVRSLSGVKGKGCYVRIIAQSDYGKGDQQVQATGGTDGSTSTSTVTTTPTTDTTVSTIVLATHEVTCGKPDTAGPPSGVSQGNSTHGPQSPQGSSHGHSADAPGKNK